VSTDRPRVIRRGAVVDWVKFDAELARDGSVDPVDKALYAAIASFVDAATRESAESAEVDPNNVPDWVPTRKRLAECIGRSVDTVDRATKRLEAYGLLRVDRQPDPKNPKRHLPSTYELLDHYRWDERAAQRSEARKATRNSSGGGRSGAATPGRTDAATPGRSGAATPGRMDAAVKDLQEGVEEESGEDAPPARSAADVRRTGAGSSARGNGGSAASSTKLRLSREQRAALRVVEAALPRPLLAQLPGQRIPGNNHRAVLAALDARTPEQIAERIGRRWVGWGFEPAFHDGQIRNPIGAAMALLGPTPYCPDPSCEDGVMAAPIGLPGAAGEPAGGLQPRRGPAPDRWRCHPAPRVRRLRSPARRRHPRRRDVPQVPSDTRRGPRGAQGPLGCRGHRPRGDGSPIRRSRPTA
jgi:hypothetical protein